MDGRSVSGASASNAGSNAGCNEPAAACQCKWCKRDFNKTRQPLSKRLHISALLERARPGSLECYVCRNYVALVEDTTAGRAQLLEKINSSTDEQTNYCEEVDRYEKMLEVHGKVKKHQLGLGTTLSQVSQGGHRSESIIGWLWTPQAYEQEHDGKKIPDGNMTTQTINYKPVRGILLDYGRR